MKVNKMQAIYKYLPKAWAIYNDTDEKEYFSAQIVSWNTKPVTGIYKAKILYEIQRQIQNFGNRGGNIDDFYNISNPNSFEFVEAAMNEYNKDINVSIAPDVFYCRSCGLVHRITKKLDNKHYCTSCKSKLIQLQMVYSCECGYTSGVKVTYPEGIDKLFYFPNKGPKSNFRFIYYSGNEKYKEFIDQCPNCKKLLYPKNAIDKVNFIPFTSTNVNLINSETGVFLEKGELAHLLIIARLLNLIDNQSYNDVLKNYDNYFSQDVKPEQKQLAEQITQTSGGSISYEQALDLVTGASKSNQFIDAVRLVREKLIYVGPQILDMLASQIIEYFSLKDAKKIITFEQAKKQALRSEAIQNELELDNCNHKAKIANVQLSSDVEIINSVYGYTRITNDPTREKKLKLKSFYFGNKYNIFTAPLNTEGILIEISNLEIINWLMDNEIIDKIPITSEIQAKEWIINHIDLSLINRFSEIKDNESIDSRVTKYTFGLLHSISHMFLRSAGKYSGLDKDSMAELILPSIPAIFIYATTIQGLTLGSLSTMFEQNYSYFIRDAMEENEVCTFDPICQEHHGSSCFACTHISDISCTHFNHDLSRAYLYGGTVIHNNQDTKIKIGFWK